MTMSRDTIFALATAPGKSGVAVIRLSGDNSLDALRALTRRETFAARQAQYVSFYSVNGDVIDRGLALYFVAPHSFTGEEVAELHLHGSIAVIRDMLETLSLMDGLRLAEPGEFTRRALTNNKLDLMEAEGLADLIAAETPRQREQALRQMDGELSGYYDGLRTLMTRVLAHLEAYIDFPDEEIPEEVLVALSGQINGLCDDIHAVLADSGRGERVRDGVNVVILGAPNAGKSSLLNAIAKRDAAIVSHQAGTTRDMIEIHLDVAGYPVVLVDTAGLRDSHDEIEAEGIRRAKARAHAADIRLVLFDGQQWPGMDITSRELLDEHAIAVITKSDLMAGVEEGALPVPPVVISTQTGEGMAELLAVLESRIVSYFSSAGAPMITRQRHRELLIQALNHLENAKKDNPLELKCEELRLAAQAVGKITGKIQVDDVLDVIFKSFCIGK